MRDAFLLLVTLFGGVAVIVAIAVAILRLVDRITIGRPKTPEERAAEERQFRKRLLDPQWQELEKRFASPIPLVLRDFYANHSRLLQTAFYVVPPNGLKESEDHFIQRFEPADLQTVTEVWFPIGNNRFPFASDDFGNYYFAEGVNDRTSSLPVFFIDHDGGDISRIANSFEEFVSWPTRKESSQAASEGSA